MEIFGILLSIPAALVSSTVYSFLLWKFVSRWPRISEWLRRVSWGVLVTCAVEGVLILTIGTLRTRVLVGSMFYPVHLFIFFASPPALANLLVLQPKRTPISSWYVAPVFCTMLAFGLVLMQYSVSEALYGINGNDGPYSLLHGHQTFASSSHFD